MNGPHECLASAKVTAPTPRGAAGEDKGLRAVRECTPMKRSLTLLPFAAFLVVLLVGQAPHAAAQQADPSGKPAPAAQWQVPASAPASQAVKPGQPPVPQPTVELKPGEVPGIVFKKPTYDFGRVRSGTDVTHEFEFTNTGNGPLEILQVKPG